MTKKEPISDEKFYDFHVANLRSINEGLSEIETLSKEAVRRNRPYLLPSLLCTYLLLIGAWTECRLRKLLFEKGGFKPADRVYVRSARTQQLQWKRTIDLGFKRRHCVKHLTLDALKHTAHGQYQSLVEAFSNDIGPVIELRNKLAHGQWEYPLTNDETQLAEASLVQLRKENLLTAKFKLQIITHIAALVHDLVVSKSFGRDFDDNYRKFTEARRNLRQSNYEKWSRALQERSRRAKEDRLR